MKDGHDKTCTPILAAGGIVLGRDGKAEIAVVQLRKAGTWMLPKGKLAAGESAVAAARREVIEETGHHVSVHEFLGTLAYETGGRQKIVRFWRMQALGGTAGKLMRDVKAMEWLALDDAIARLTHVREQVFLAEVGPLALHLALRSTPAPVPQSDAPLVPELTAPVDFATSLPPERWSGGRRREKTVVEKSLLEKTWDWLRARPQRD